MRAHARNRTKAVSATAYQRAVQLTYELLVLGCRGRLLVLAAAHLHRVLRVWWQWPSHGSLAADGLPPLVALVLGKDVVVVFVVPVFAFWHVLARLLCVFVFVDVQRLIGMLCMLLNRISCMCIWRLPVRVLRELRITHCLPIVVDEAYGGLFHVLHCILSLCMVVLVLSRLFHLQRHIA